MLSVAEKSFGFVQGERMNVFIGDGIQFIKESCSAGKKGTIIAYLTYIMPLIL